MNRKAIIFGIKGHLLSKGEKALIKKTKPWGIILFSRNIKSIEQTKKLTDDIKKIFNDKKYPILIDQEGGKVSRLNKILDFSLFSQAYFGNLYSGFSVSYQSLQTSYNKGSEAFGSFNKDLSRENSITLSHGIDLLNDRHSSLSIGYNLNYMLFYQAPSAGVNGNGVNGLSSGESGTFTLDVGIHSSLRNKINFGAFIKNITSSRLGKGSSLTFLPRRLNVGVGYTPYPDLSTHFALDRNMDEKRSSFRFGFEYLVNKNFEVKSGIQMSENNNRFGLGFSIYLEYFDISYSVMTHPIIDNINILEIRIATFE